MALPLANFSLFWFTLSEFMFYSFATPAGVALILTTGIAVIAAILAFTAGIRKKMAVVMD